MLTQRTHRADPPLHGTQSHLRGGQPRDVTVPERGARGRVLPGKKKHRQQLTAARHAALRVRALGEEAGGGGVSAGKKPQNDPQGEKVGTAKDASGHPLGRRARHTEEGPPSRSRHAGEGP